MVCSGLIDQLYAYFSVVYGPLDDCHSAQLVLDMLNILVATTALFHYKYCEKMHVVCETDLLCIE